MRIRASGVVEEVGRRRGYRVTNWEQAEANGALPEVRPAIYGLPASSESIVGAVKDPVLFDDPTTSTTRYSIAVNIYKTRSTSLGWCI